MENKCDPKSKYYDEEANYFYDYYYVNDRNHSHCVDGPYFKTKSGQVGYAISGIHFTKEEWEKHPEVIKASYKESYNRCDPKSKFYDKSCQENYNFYYVDNRNRSHCVDGPYCRNKFGSVFYAINGSFLFKDEWAKHHDVINVYKETYNKCDPRSKFFDKEYEYAYDYYYVDEQGRDHNYFSAFCQTKITKEKLYAINGARLSKEDLRKYNTELLNIPLLNRCDPNCKFYSEWYKEHYTFFYVNDKNERHFSCIDGTQYPASKSNDGTLWYSINGKNHRLDGPAIIYPDGHKRYYIDGIEYREEDYYKNVLVTAPKNSMDDKLPTEKEISIESYDKCDPKSFFYEKKIADYFKYYYVNGNGERHKDEGQIQSESKDNDIYYVVNDKFHRLDGPALYNINRNYKNYFINGKDYPEKEYWEHPDVKNYPDNKISKRINGWLLDNKTYWENPKKWQTQYVETYDRCDIHSFYYDETIASLYKYYYVNDLGIAHKDNSNGPQSEDKDNYIDYIVNDLRHHLTGAAFIYEIQNRLDYYLYGEKVTFEEFQKHPDVIANFYESYNKCDPYSQFYDVMIAQSYEFYYINKEQISSRNTKLPSFRRKIAGIKSDSILIGYTIDGKFHRLDGPAITYANGKVDYYLNGNFISPKDYWTSSEVMDYVNKTYYHSIKWNEVRFMSDEDISKLFLKIGYYIPGSNYKCRITDANPSSKIDLSKDISVVDKKPTKEDMKRALDAIDDISNIRASGDKIVTNGVTDELKNHIDFLTNRLVEPKNSALEELQNIAQYAFTDELNRTKESASSPTIGLDLGANEPSRSLMSEVSIVGDPSNPTTIVKMKPEATSSDIGKIHELLDKSDPDYAHNACDDGPSWLSKAYDYCYLDGKDRFHNNNGPAFKKKGEDQFGYYQHGQLHRLDGPALIVPDKQPQYYIRGVNYSETQYYNHPEVTKDKPISNEIVSLNDICNPDSKFYNKDYADVYLHYFVNDEGVAHCDNGPAIINVSKQQFYKNGLRHRLDGAAVIYTNENGDPEFWINGNLYNSNRYWKHPDVIEFNKDKIQTSTTHSNEWYIKNHPIDGESIFVKNNSQLLTDVKLTEDNSYKESYDRCDPKSKFYSKYYTDHHYTKALVNDKGEFHCDNGPAVCSNQEQDYYKNGKLHRLDGPAIITDQNKDYYINDELFFEQNYWKHPDVIAYKEKMNVKTDESYDKCDPNSIYYDENITHNYEHYYVNKLNQPHCETGPALIYKNGRVEYYIGGLYYRLDGAAILNNDGKPEKYYIDGVLYSSDHYWTNTKVLRFNKRNDYYVESYNKCDPKSKYFYHHNYNEFKYCYVNKNGLIHNDIGPAIKTYNGVSVYFSNGKLHRLNGPATLNESGGEVRYYINGVRYSEEEYKKHPDVIAYTEKLKNYKETFDKCDPLSKFYDRHTAENYQFCFVDDDGKLHKRGGPAALTKYEKDNTYGYWYHGKRHRLDGPAFHGGKDNKLEEYFIDDRNYSKEEYYKHPLVLNYGKPGEDKCNPEHINFYDENYAKKYKTYKISYVTQLPHCGYGPAIIHNDDTEEYYISGNSYSKEDFYNRPEVKQLILDLQAKETATKAASMLDNGELNHLYPPISENDSYNGCDPKSKFYNKAHDDSYKSFQLNEKGYLHRLDGPAVIKKSGEEYYYINGVEYLAAQYWEHPAVIAFANEKKSTDSQSFNKIYWNDSSIIDLCDDKSKFFDVSKAMEYKHYYVNNKLEAHNENGPALVFKEGRVEYRINGRAHRLDGPAYIKSDGSTYYYINGVHYFEEEWKKHPRVIEAHEKYKSYKNVLGDFINPKIKFAGDKTPDSVASHFKSFFKKENFEISASDDVKKLELLDLKDNLNSGIAKLLSNMKNSDVTYNKCDLKSSKYDEDYHKRYARYVCNERGFPHCLDGPAVIDWDGSEHYYIEGSEIREDLFLELAERLKEVNNKPDVNSTPYVESYNRCDPKSKFYQKETASKFKYFYVKEDYLPHRGGNQPQSEAINKGYINYIVDGKYHRLGGPAIIHNDGRSSLSHYYINGEKFSEKEYEEHPEVKLYKKAKAFFVKDSHDRCNPAFEHYHKFYEDNYLHFYANEKGWAHCLDGPALIYKDGRVEYFIDGQKYSEQDYKLKIAQKTSEVSKDSEVTDVSDVPYKETFDRCDPKSLYYQQGYDNLIHLYVNKYERRHCDNGPAIVHKDGSYEYWVNGLRHRLDGPASSFKNGTVQEYFLLGIEYKDKESFQKKAKELLKLENKLFPLEKQTIIKESDKKMEKKSFLEMSKEDAIDGAYRAGARQAVAIVKKNTLKLIEGNTSSAGMEALSNLLSTEFGTAVLSMGAGLALTYAPGISENDKAARLAKEFRVEGYSISMEQLVTLVMSAMGPSLQEVMEKLPSVSMEVTPAKAKKKLRVKPPELPKEEEIEVDDEEYETDDDFNQLNNA